MKPLLGMVHKTGVLSSALMQCLNDNVLIKQPVVSVSVLMLSLKKMSSTEEVSCC